MNLGKIFLILSSSILILSIININTGPIVSLAIGKDWGNLNCDKFSDIYDYVKEEYSDFGIDIDEDTKKYQFEYPIKECQRRKGMHAMEYSSFVIDSILGFVLTFISFLHFLGIKNEYIPITALIGISSSGIGFIFTFIYIVYNGLVYTNDYYILKIDYDTEMPIFKSDSDMSFAKLDNEGRYKCIDYDTQQNVYSFYAKYKDYHKNQYNYDKDLFLAYIDNLKITRCTKPKLFNDCFENGGYISGPITYTDNSGRSLKCRKLYFFPYENNELKNISDKFLTTLIFSLFICLCQIGLIISGIFLYRTPEF